MKLDRLINKLWKPVAFLGLLRLLSADPVYAQSTVADPVSQSTVTVNTENQLNNKIENVNVKAERVDNRNTYFTGTTDSDGQCILSNVIIPVELKEIDYSIDNDLLNFNCKTASETNNYGFYLEQKINDNWKELGFINGNGTTNKENNYSFNLDLNRFNIESGFHDFRLRQIDFNGEQSEYLFKVNIPIPEAEIGKIGPNPGKTFNIPFRVNKSGNIDIIIYNILGQEVKHIVNNNFNSGYYHTIWDGRNNLGEIVSDGVYLVKIKGDGFNKVRKCVFVKDGAQADFKGSYKALFDGFTFKDKIDLDQIITKFNKTSNTQGIVYDIIFSAEHITPSPDTLKNVLISADTTINRSFTEVINFNYNISDMFDSAKIKDAVITSDNNSETSDENGNLTLKVPIKEDALYSFTTTHSDYFTHEYSISTTAKDTSIEELIVPNSFNMSAFDEGYRSDGYTFVDATSRWKTPEEGGTQPKIYIDITNILQDSELDSMKNLWTSVIDEVVTELRKAKYNLFPDSVEIEFGTNRPSNDTDNYMIIWYSSTNGTGWKFDGNEIKNSRTIVTPGIGDPTICRAIYIHEFLRKIGFTGYVPDSEPSVGNALATLPNLNIFDKNCIYFLYSRKWGSKKDDIGN